MKYYTRIGRRFVQVKSVKGMFYNKDGTFSEKRTDKSIGICVHDDFDETIIASLGISESEISYDVAESVCKAAFPLGEGHIPTGKEIFMLLDMKVIKPKGVVSLWISDDANDFSAIVYGLHFYSSGAHMHFYSRHYGVNKIIPFLTIKDRI